MTLDITAIRDIVEWIQKADPRSFSSTHSNQLAPSLFEMLELAIECEYVRESSVYDVLHREIENLFKDESEFLAKEIVSRPLIVSLLSRYKPTNVQTVYTPTFGAEATRVFISFTAVYDTPMVASTAASRPGTNRALVNRQSVARAVYRSVLCNGDQEGLTRAA